MRSSRRPDRSRLVAERKSSRRPNSSNRARCLSDLTAHNGPLRGPFFLGEAEMAFRFEKLTVKAQEAVQHAQDVAERHGHQQLVPLHLLEAFLQEEGGIVRPLLQKI